MSFNFTECGFLFLVTKSNLEGGRKGNVILIISYKVLVDSGWIEDGEVFLGPAQLLQSLWPGGSVDIWVT